MKKTSRPRVQVKRETIRQIAVPDLKQVTGGQTEAVCTQAIPVPPADTLKR